MAGSSRKFNACKHLKKKEKKKGYINVLKMTPKLADLAINQSIH